MTSDLPHDQDERLVLTKAQEADIMTALRASEEDFVAGRWISLEDYETQTLARRQARNAAKDN